MKRLNLTYLIVLFFSIPLLVFSSCSDDDDETPPPPAQPSRVIKKIMIYKTTGSETKVLTSVDLVYDRNQRIELIRQSTPLSVINYRYSDDGKISYNYSSESSSLIEVSATLESGKAYVCQFSNSDKPTVYSYTNNYLRESTNGNLTMQYTWEGENLKSISSLNQLYNSKFTPSTVSNDYSLDLNALVQLTDERSGYIETMNVYGQIAGILGARSQYLLQDSDYFYDCSFDQNLRLKEILRMNSEDIYSFRFSYEDNILQ